MTNNRQRTEFEAWRGRGVHAVVIDELFAKDADGRYKLSKIEEAWLAWQARDAEVQALREELLNYVSADEMAVGEGYGTYPKSEHRRIRALVAGEEGSDND